MEKRPKHQDEWLVHKSINRKQFLFKEELLVDAITNLLGKYGVKQFDKDVFAAIRQLLERLLGRILQYAITNKTTHVYTRATEIMAALLHYHGMDLVRFDQKRTIIEGKIRPIRGLLTWLVSVGLPHYILQVIPEFTSVGDIL